MLQEEPLSHQGIYAPCPLRPCPAANILREHDTRNEIPCLIVVSEPPLTLARLVPADPSHRPAPQSIGHWPVAAGFPAAARFARPNKPSPAPVPHSDNPPALPDTDSG